MTIEQETDLIIKCMGKVILEHEAEIERLRKDAEQIWAFRDHGVFGLLMAEGETLADAANRWYAEFDKVRESDHKEVERLQDRLRAAHGGCRMLSEGDACDCGLCKRDNEIDCLKKERDKLRDEVKRLQPFERLQPIVQWPTPLQ